MAGFVQSITSAFETFDATLFAFSQNEISFKPLFRLLIILEIVFWILSSSAKVAIAPHPASSLIENIVFFYNNNLIQVFTLSSVRNSINFFFDTLTKFQQPFVSMFYRKERLKTKG